ncbi:MAG: M48 family metallopeptidase [Flavobacteriales bacterium]|nr:M48 family metallopeptidase [Flavobacteriales bacterium]
MRSFQVRLFIILVICFPLCTLAQDQAQLSSIYSRTYSDTLPEAFRIDIPKLREHIYSGVPHKFKVLNRGRASYRFSDESAFGISQLISDGSVYSDWYTFELYLNEVMSKIIPPELANDTIIHAYLRQSGHFNAFMTPSGMTFIYLGLFAYVEDEATLAGILAHELAHYYLQHSLTEFMLEQKGHFRRWAIFNTKRQSRFSIRNELSADSLAMIWMRTSGYHVEGLINSFEISERLEKQQLALSESEVKLEEETHPLAGKRLARLKAYLKKHKAAPGEKYLVSERAFHEFREEAKPEILKHLLNNFYYAKCVEMAFFFHIYDPDNTTYIYYLMEGIRRSCYLNNNLWSENFITYRYYDNYTDDFGRQKRKMEEHLFEEFDFDVIPISPVNAAKIIAEFYWQGDPRFKTNEQAFEFFYQVSQALKSQECVLSNALSRTQDTVARDSLLKQYLGYEDIEYREFSQTLMDGNIIKSLTDKRLLVFNRLITYVRQGKDEIAIRIHKESDYGPRNMFDSIKTHYPKRIPVYMPDLKYNRLNDFKMLKELEQFSFYTTIAIGERTELHILDPRYWRALQEFGVNEIEFINCIYTEYRKSEETLAEFKKLVRTNYATIFAQIKRARDIEVLISSVRLKHKAIMKTKYTGGENKLKFKEPALNQIIAEILYDLRKKDEMVKERDRSYKMLW